MTETGRILAVDFGKRRVGLAISDPTGSIAFPLKTIDRKKDPNPLEKQITSVVAEHDIKRVVIGLPLTESGKKGAMALEVESFISRLEPLVGCEVVSWDERFTTARAVKIIHEIGEKTGKDKGKVDRISAVIILQNYLDSTHGGLC